HALRRAHSECGFVNDPTLFGNPAEVLASGAFHQMVADILKAGKPNIDLTKHVELSTGPNAMKAAKSHSDQPSGSCELSLVDQQGNWVQMMNTLQSGGIPGEVVDGVCMVGSHMTTGLGSAIAGFLTGGGRMRSVIGNTIVLKDGKPVWSLGSPGNVHCTVPQVL